MALTAPVGADSNGTGGDGDGDGDGNCDGGASLLLFVGCSELVLMV